ncbi:prepilin-type N-terminal cleavage/methylation domain-containing protein [Coraliomargarita sp. W4R72]
MLVHPPISVRRHSKTQGFTLIELLMVIAVILILAGITFGISRGVQNAQARARAKADLAAIAQALEQFKSVYGDYPTTENPATSDIPIKQANQRLVLSLRGEMVWTYDSGKVVGMETRVASDDYGNELNGGRVFINEETLNADAEYDGVAQFQDPWGNAYIYDYTRLNGSWDNFGYILCSAGPDGNYESVGNDGILTSTIRNHEDNIDNIYYGE